MAKVQVIEIHNNIVSFASRLTFPNIERLKIINKEHPYIDIDLLQCKKLHTIIVLKEAKFQPILDNWDRKQDEEYIDNWKYTSK